MLWRGSYTAIWGNFLIDNNQGVDDVIAMLLAFSAKPEELDILMLSLTFGNVDVQRCVGDLS